MSENAGVELHKFHCICIFGKHLYDCTIWLVPIKL